MMPTASEGFDNEGCIEFILSAMIVDPEQNVPPLSVGHRFKLFMFGLGIFIRSKNTSYCNSLLCYCAIGIT
jgi:hypothetical protein